LKSAQAEIILRARGGDLEAFRQIHEAYARRILNFINRMVDSREDAEDLTQNVFLSAFHELANLQDDERFESWLYRIARNEVYQSFRKRRVEPQGFEPVKVDRDGNHLPLNIADGRPSPQDRILQEELGDTIRELLSSLPPKLREVFVLAVIDEKSYAEISDIVGRSLLSVKTDIFRARSQARRFLGKYLEVSK
jgi:RNA polymerase sigma-70 factor, ECF subfamily